MFAATQDPVKIHKSDLKIWMKIKGFKNIRGNWMNETHCVKVTELLNGYVSVQIGRQVK
jgi:hypothetical protein